MTRYDPNLLDINSHPRLVDDPDKPNTARVYDALLGGSMNTTVDRAHAAQAEKLMPGTRECACTNRRFAVAAVETAIRHNVRQFLDLGAGIPTVGGLHEIALRADPGARWVAVDNELVAVAAGQVFTEGDDRVQYIDADFTKPDSVLSNPDVLSTLDLSRPVMVLLCAALHLVGDFATALAVVDAYREATVPGSMLALSHGTADDPNLPGMSRLPELYERASNQYTPRPRAEIVQFARGYDLLPPGCVLTADWRPDDILIGGRKPLSGAYAFVGTRL